jgi:hypothetical protein
MSDLRVRLATDARQATMRVDITLGSPHRLRLTSLRHGVTRDLASAADGTDELCREATMHIEEQLATN